MRLTRIFISLLLGLFLVAIPIAAPVNTSKPARLSQADQKEISVWVNTSSGVYHCPGTRWYGKTKRGKYMGECAAIKDGNRPAYGRACGSACK